MCAIRILIAEDDRDIGDLLQATLDPPYECLHASDGLQAFHMALEGEPDLIVSDIMMPVMDGYQFIMRLRREPTLASVPVIFLSALGSREQIRKGYDLGATLYLTKPIDPSRLRRNVEMFLRDHAISSNPKKKSVREVKLAVNAPRPTATPAPKEDTTSKRAAQPTPASKEDTASRRAAQQTPASKEDTTSRRAAKPAPRPEPVAGESTTSKKMVVRAGPSTPPSTHEASPRPRILVVEDDRDAQEMMRVGLERDYEIIQARDGIEAIERAVRYKPDLFIIDGMLPKMTGYQLVSMLRKNRMFHESPAVFISGKATVRDKQYVERLGVQHFLAKPFEIGQMKKVLETICADPGFRVQTDRMPFQQMMLETLRDFETHRTDAMRLAQMMKSSKSGQGTAP